MQTATQSIENVQNAITKETSVAKAAVLKILEKIKDCKPTTVRSAFDTLLGDIDTLKSNMKGSIKSFEDRMLDALTKVTTKKVDDAIDGLSKDCRPKSSNIVKIVTDLVNSIKTMINSLIKVVKLEANKDIGLLPLSKVLGSR